MASSVEVEDVLKEDTLDSPIRHIRAVEGITVPDRTRVLSAKQVGMCVSKS